MICWGLYWGPPIFGNYRMGLYRTNYRDPFPAFASSQQVVLVGNHGALP